MSIYALKDPRDGRCRYVGVSRRPHERLGAHIAGDATTKRLRRWMTELRSIGAEPTMAFLRGGTEAQWIEQLRPDLNVRRGSDDPLDPRAREAVATLQFSDDGWADICLAAEKSGRPVLSYASELLTEAARTAVVKAARKDAEAKKP